MLFALCVSAEAQQPTKIPQLGLVVANRETTSVREFQQGLRELGYIEGKNILFEYRYTERNLDRIPSLVSELVQLKVDVLLLSNFRAIRAAKQATQTIPVVMVTTQDPVETGIIDSLARPGGNITGLTRLTRDLSGKRLELLKEAIPKISRWEFSADSRPDVEASGSAIALKEYEEAAHALKLRLQSLEVRGPNPDWEGAFQVAAKGRAGALITIHNALIVRYPKADCGPCHQEPTTINVRRKQLRGSRWPYVLLLQRCRPV